MASSSAVQGKTNFFHFPFQSKIERQKKQDQPGQDSFDGSAEAAKLNRLPKKDKPQALSQGDEVARKGGFLDCFGLLALFSLCCICCQGSGNNGYGRRFAKTPKLNKVPPPATGTSQPLAANQPTTLVSGTGQPPVV